MARTTKAPGAALAVLDRLDNAPRERAADEVAAADGAGWLDLDEASGRRLLGQIAARRAARSAD